MLSADMRKLLPHPSLAWPPAPSSRLSRVLADAPTDLELPWGDHVRPPSPFGGLGAAQSGGSSLSEPGTINRLAAIPRHCQLMETRWAEQKATVQSLIVNDHACEFSEYYCRVCAGLAARGWRGQGASSPYSGYLRLCRIPGMLCRRFEARHFLARPPSPHEWLSAVWLSLRDALAAEQASITGPLRRASCCAQPANAQGHM